jgi:hypothetical protein
VRVLGLKDAAHAAAAKNLGDPKPAFQHFTGAEGHPIVFYRIMVFFDGTAARDIFQWSCSDSCHTPNTGTVRTRTIIKWTVKYIKKVLKLGCGLRRKNLRASELERRETGA